MERKKANCIPIVILGRSVYVNNAYEPAANVSATEGACSKYKLQGVTRDKLLEELQEEFEATVESIERYGGFYIGRYETGKRQAKQIVVQRMQLGFNVSWFEAYGATQTIGTNKNVKSSMIFGCLWDETLQWLIDSGNKTYADMVDSTSWGNYNSTTFEYITINGNTSTKASGSNTRIPTGSAEYTKANNIYDMAGNFWNMTLENYSNFGIQKRGGNSTVVEKKYLSTGNRTGSNSIATDGARAYLYIK